MKRQILKMVFYEPIMLKIYNILNLKMTYMIQEISCGVHGWGVPDSPLLPLLGSQANEFFRDAPADQRAIKTRILHFKSLND